MIAKVLNYVQMYQMIEADDTIVAGVSGGADSVCLLFVLSEIQKTIPFSLSVVHVNHGIREEACRDAEYVEKLCAEQGIPFYLVKEDVKAYAGQYGLSEEETGRIIRYQAFEKVLEQQNRNKKGKIAVAHHANDCAETMLFHLFRGSGLRGAVGIRPVNNHIIRPLLCLERKEIEAWLQERKIDYCHDNTNDGDDYTRNRIRHHILPLAEQEICNGAVAHMNKASEHLLQTELFVERMTAGAMERCCERKNGEITIRISDYEKEDAYLQGQMLLTCLHEISPGRKDITSVHIEGIKELMGKDGSKEIHLPYGICVCKVYDRVTIKREAALRESEVFGQLHVREVGNEEYVFNGEGQIEVPCLGNVEFTVFSYEKDQNIPQKTYTKWFDYDKIKQSVHLRKRRSGDYLTINSRMGRKTLQDYFVNEKIPKSKRDNMYVLADDSHIMWVPGYRISEYYKVTENTKKVLQVTINGNHT